MNTLYDNTSMPRLGQGTWFMGENKRLEENEIQSLRLGIEHGMTLIDTAEMYGDGKSEQLIGKAIKDIDRSKLFLVSKVYPHNAGKNRIFASCDKTLERLGTSYLDLYLLHWRGSVPLAETVQCMEELVEAGKIRHWGVSNFDTNDMEELFSVPNGNKCAVNQVLYHLGSRGIEFDLLPWLQAHNVVTMAYCPLAQAGSLRHGILNSKSVQSIAKKYDATAGQVMLAFVLRHNLMCVIPKAGTSKHVLENAEAKKLLLTEEDLCLLSNEFPPPTHKMWLDIV